MGTLRLGTIRYPLSVTGRLQSLADLVDSPQVTRWLPAPKGPLAEVAEVPSLRWGLAPMVGLLLVSAVGAGAFCGDVWSTQFEHLV